MDGTSRRVAALHKESQELAAEAMAIKKALPLGAAKPQRLKDILARLRAVESEYSQVLNSAPSAVASVDTAADNQAFPPQFAVLQSEIKELRRRNEELERKVLTLQQFHQQAKENQIVLQQRQMQAEKDLVIARKEIKDVRSAKATDSGFLEMATHQLSAAAAKVQAMRVETDEKAARIESRLEVTMKDMQTSQRDAGILRSEVELLGTMLKKERQRADAAEALVQELRQDVSTISSQVVEAKKHLVKASEDEAAVTRPLLVQGEHKVLRKWAEDELRRLKQQLAATCA